MCVKEEYENWTRRDMGVADFRKIVPYLSQVGSVVLEGWGESLLHKDLIEFVRLAKAEGPEVGFVTSGMGLNESYLERLIDGGVDFMGFSLSGGTAETHNRIRANSDFDALLGVIRVLTSLKKKRGLKKPHVHIVYLMLKDNVGELAMVIEKAKEIGVDEVILINIALVSNREQDREKAFACDDEGISASGAVKEAKMIAGRLDIKLTAPGLSLSDVAVCSENPLDNLYISVDGEVSPCVYLYPPVPSPFKRVFCGGEHLQEKVSFGNIFKEPFETIWSRPEYVAFRGCFEARREKMKEAYEALLSLKRTEDTGFPDPPLPCRMCYKIRGV
jgi:MoaA/NifB/PqqE/SkfB family radical SAM enzyme